MFFSVKIKAKSKRKRNQKSVCVCVCASFCRGSQQHRPHFSITCSLFPKSRIFLHSKIIPSHPLHLYPFRCSPRPLYKSTGGNTKMENIQGRIENKNNTTPISMATHPPYQLFPTGWASRNRKKHYTHLAIIIQPTHIHRSPPPTHNPWPAPVAGHPCISLFCHLKPLPQLTPPPYQQSLTPPIPDVKWIGKAPNPVSLNRPLSHQIPNNCSP